MTRPEQRTAWTRARQERRITREREFGTAIAAMNAFRSNPAYGVIETDVLTLAALPAAKNCALFLWVARPEDLCLAVNTMADWGFEYKTCFFIASPPHQLILIGTRGRVPAPAPGTQLTAMVGSDELREWIARMFPSTPRLTLWQDCGSAPG